MTEKKLISKIQQLQQIKPGQNWVVFTKERILGEEFGIKRERMFKVGCLRSGIEQFEKFFQHRFAFASLAVLMIFAGVFGAFGLAQNSLPGDSLFSLKKITEKSQAVFVSEKDQSRYNLEIVNKRLDDLTKVAENNKINNLASAIKEVQKSEEQAVESLHNIEIKKDSKKVEEIANQVKKIVQKKQELKKVYGVAGLEESNKDADSTEIVVEWLIEDMESKSLTMEQEKSLAEAKQEYEKGNYSQALETILLNQ